MYLICMYLTIYNESSTSWKLNRYWLLFPAQLWSSVICVTIRAWTISGSDLVVKPIFLILPQPQLRHDSRNVRGVLRVAIANSGFFYYFRFDPERDSKIVGVSFKVHWNNRFNIKAVAGKLVVTSRITKQKIRNSEQPLSLIFYRPVWFDSAIRRSVFQLVRWTTLAVLWAITESERLSWSRTNHGAVGAVREIAAHESS